MNRLFLVVLLAVLAQLSVQKGTLYLNEIQSIPDLVTGLAQLPIECTLWVENEIYLDTIYAIPQIGTQQFRNHGVDIDGVLVYNGTWIFPSTFDVAQHVLVYGLIQPDGGWFCDDGGAGDVDGDGSDFSWSVEDNTGNTFVAGTLDIALGINNQDDINTPFATFDVKQSGETFIEGVLYPNGGINILDGIVLVDDDGDIFGAGDLTVEGDLFYGRDGFSGALSEYSIYFPPFSVDGGDLTLHGQDADRVGGDIVFVPGLPEGASIINKPGRVILGRRNENYDLLITRATTDNGDAGDYTISGQTSNARGGDLEFQAGNSIRIDYYTDIELGNGGDIILDPGLGVGGFGNIVLGDPNDGANIPYIITRPDILDSDSAGDTLFRGQDTLQSFRGGDLFVVAGDGSLRGGDIHLIPGSNGPFQADIKLGNLQQNRPENLLLGRLADPEPVDASDTYFIAQDSTGSTGGDLWFVGGDGSDTLGGSIFISPGRRNGGVIGGVIVWGTSDDALFVERPYAYGDGTSTTIAGQDSTGDFPGGDLYFLSGDGTTAGGNLDILAGDGDHGFGGDILIQTGVGLVTGGDIQITSGDGFPAGDILIFGGRSGLTSTSTFPIDSNGGNIIIDAGVCTGLGCANGEIQLNNAARVFIVNVPLLIDATTNAAALLHLNTGVTSITFNSVPSANGFLLYSDAGGNVYPLFQPRITLPSTIYSTINPYTNLVGAYSEVATNFAVLRAGLLSHGLIV